jgi:hypothetical protein
MKLLEEAADIVSRHGYVLSKPDFGSAVPIERARPTELRTSG